MKFASLLLVSTLLLAVTSSQAQPQTPIERGGARQKKNVAPQAQEEKANWLFMLETKTQWLLVIQNNGSGSNGVRNAGADSSSSAGIITDGTTNTAANGTNATGLGKAIGSAPKKEDDAIVFNNDKNTIVFEGNTNDLPLLPPLTNPGKSPSAPDT